MTKYIYSDPEPAPGAMPGTVVPPDAPEPKPAEWWAQAGREAANSATFGMAHRGAAAYDALTGDAAGYNEALKERVAQSEAWRKQNPGAGAAADLTGGVATGLGSMLLKAPSLVRAGAPLWQRALGGAAEGSAFAAAQGAGQTYTGNPTDYATNAMSAIPWGFGFGAAAPAVGAAVGRVADTVSNFGSGIPRKLQQAARADEAGLRTLPPGGMMPDAGPNMLGTAQGAAVGQSTAAGQLRQVLTERNQQTGARVRGDVDATFGPAPVPSRVVSAIEDDLQALSPHYERVLNSPNVRAVDTSELANNLQVLIQNRRGAAQSEARSVLQMLEIPGAPGQLDPHPSAVHAVRSAVRSRLRALERTEGADGAVIGVLADIDRQLTSRLNPSVPGLSAVDDAYSQLHQQMRGFQTGRNIFDKGKEALPPQQAADEFNAITNPAVPGRIAQGARAELERIVGSNPNDLRALRSLLGDPSDWNAQKLALVFGPTRANRLMDRLSSEERFRNTYNKVVEDSQTAQRTAAKEALDAGQKKIPLETSATGLMLRGAQEGLNAIGRAMFGRRAQTHRDQIAEIMATRDPVQINNLIDRILEVSGKNASRADIARALATRAATGASGALAE